MEEDRCAGKAEKGDGRMNREQALNYLRSSGFSEEQIQTVVEALTDKDAVSREAVMKVVNNPFIRRDEVIKELPSVTPTRRWIPVSERLSEEHICSDSLSQVSMY